MAVPHAVVSLGISTSVSLLTCTSCPRVQCDWTRSPNGQILIQSLSQRSCLQPQFGSEVRGGGGHRGKARASTWEITDELVTLSSTGIPSTSRILSRSHISGASTERGKARLGGFSVTPSYVCIEWSNPTRQHCSLIGASML